MAASLRLHPSHCTSLPSRFSGDACDLSSLSLEQKLALLDQQRVIALMESERFAQELESAMKEEPDSSSSRYRAHALKHSQRRSLPAGISTSWMADLSYYNQDHWWCNHDAETKCNGSTAHKSSSPARSDRHRPSRQSASSCSSSNRSFNGRRRRGGRSSAHGTCDNASGSRTRMRSSQSASCLYALAP